MKKIVFLMLAMVFFISVKNYAETYGSISGKVTTDKGVSVEGVGIEITNYKDIDEKFELAKIGKNTISKYSNTDKYGIFKYELFPVGKYYLQVVGMPEYYKKLYKEKMLKMPVELPEGQNLTDINIEISRYYGTLSGKVFKNDGITPYHKARVELTLDSTRQTDSDGVDENGNYCIIYKPSENSRKIIVEGILGDKIYILASTFVFNTPDDIKYDIVFSEENITGFYGKITNVDGSVYDQVISGGLSIEMVYYPYLSVIPDFDSVGNYYTKGLIPGEYKFSFFKLFREPKGPSGRRLFKRLILDSTYTITNLGEQKQVNLIYNETHGKIEITEIR